MLKKKKNVTVETETSVLHIDISNSGEFFVFLFFNPEIQSCS